MNERRSSPQSPHRAKFPGYLSVSFRHMHFTTNHNAVHKTTTTEHTVHTESSKSGCLEIWQKTKLSEFSRFFRPSKQYFPYNYKVTNHFSSHFGTFFVHQNPVDHYQQFT